MDGYMDRLIEIVTTWLTAQATQLAQASNEMILMPAHFLQGAGWWPSGEAGEGMFVVVLALAGVVVAFKGVRS